MSAVNSKYVYNDPLDNNQSIKSIILNKHYIEYFHIVLYITGRIILKIKPTFID